MTNYLTRKSIVFKNFNSVKFFRKINSRREKLLLEFRLIKGNILDTKTDNIAILLNPFKSCFYDSKTTKIILEKGGSDLIEEINDIRNYHKQELFSNNNLITGSGGIEDYNNKIKNIFHVIGENNFENNKKFEKEKILTYYRNLFSKIQKENRFKVSLPPLLQLKEKMQNII